MGRLMEYTSKMERICLQAYLAWFTDISPVLLRIDDFVSYRANEWKFMWSNTETKIWIDVYLCPKIFGFNTDSFANWFLCYECRVKMVGPVHGFTLPWQTCFETCSFHPRTCKLLIHVWDRIPPIHVIESFKVEDIQMYITMIFQSKQLKNLRRTVMRYVNLSSILAYTKITSSLAKKFPTYNSFIENKIMLEHEVSFGTYYCHDYITHKIKPNFQ